MFNQKNRLRKTKEIENAFKIGRSFYNNILGFRVIKNDLEESRFCIIISSKISKKAVVRNKIKRRIRYIINNDLTKIKKSFDVVVVVNKNIIDLDFSDLKNSVVDSLKKLNPVNPINAKARIPSTIKTIPFPASPFGTSETFFIFSRIPATNTIASNQPTEEPNE